MIMIYYKKNNNFWFWMQSMLESFAAPVLARRLYQAASACSFLHTVTNFHKNMQKYCCKYLHNTPSEQKLKKCEH